MGPEISLALRARLSAGWGPVHRIDAIVDSGATGSSIQVADAEAMGVTSTHRAAGGKVRYANGDVEQVQRASVTIAARLVDPATGEFWGPTFTLQPSLKPSGDRLLGTGDFFEAFEVAIWPGGAQSRFSLAC